MDLKIFRQILSPLSAFFMGTMFACLGFALLSSVLAIRLSQNGASTTLAGVVLSLYYLGYIIASQSAYKIINKVGQIRAFSAFVSVFSALALMHYFSPNPSYWGLLRLMEGYCIGSSFMCLESWLNTRTSNQTRGMIMAIYMLISYLGAGVGQLMLNLADKSGVFIYILVSIIFSLALVPISLTALPTPDLSIAKSMSLLKIYKKTPVGVMGCIISGVLVGMFYSLGVIYAHKVGLTLKQTSFFMFFGIIGGMLAQIPLGRLSDVFDRRFVLMYICGVAFFIIPWLHLFINDGGWHLAISTMLLGVCTFSLYPISVSHVNDMIKDDERVGTSGMMIMLQSVGLIVGPIVVAFFMQEFGEFSFILSYSVICGFFVLYVLKDIAKHPNITYVEVTKTDPIPLSASSILPELLSDDK